jgi:hypothetical protein
MPAVFERGIPALATALQTSAKNRNKRVFRYIPGPNLSGMYPVRTHFEWGIPPIPQLGLQSTYTRSSQLIPAPCRLRVPSFFPRCSSVTSVAELLGLAVRSRRCRAITATGALFAPYPSPFIPRSKGLSRNIPIDMVFDFSICQFPSAICQLPFCQLLLYQRPLAFSGHDFDFVGSATIRGRLGCCSSDHGDCRAINPSRRSSGFPHYHLFRL